MNKGFTLIELLVVVLIIGILAAIAVPMYMRAVERARFTEAVYTLTNLSRAQWIFFTQNNKLATSLEELNTGDVTFPNLTAGEDGRLEGSSYNFSFSTDPTDPGSLVQISGTRKKGSLSGCYIQLKLYKNGTSAKINSCGPDTINSFFNSMANDAGYI